MKYDRVLNKTCAGFCLLAWGVLTLPLAGQTSQQAGNALEQTNLTWNATGWTVGTLVRGRADVLAGTNPEEGGGPLLQTTITGPAKLVFDWTVAEPNSVAKLGLSVDGHELQL